MSYGRLGYFALKQESTENTAVTPDVFIPIMSEDIVAEYAVTPAMPVSGIRSLNLRDIKNATSPPTGSVSILIEPKTFGYFMKGVFGAVSTGEYVKISSLSADFTVGETVTGGTSSATATVVATSSEGDYVLVSGSSGAFTVGETITGGTSSSTATVVLHSQSVYGHQFTAPQSSLPTYTVEIGFLNEAYRYTGVRFNGFESVAHSDNIVTADVSLTARAEFKHGRVTAVTTSGAGAKTITVDQTTGLAASDTIKLYRPGTGYVDFSASSVKTHTVGSITSENAFTITNLESDTAVGDLIVLAPQTASYSIASEFCWIGGSSLRNANTITAALSGTVSGIEDFELGINNELEPRHAADGSDIINRFPSTNYLKGLTGTGRFNKVYTDMTFLDKMRTNRDQAMQLVHEAAEISSSGINYTLDWRVPNFTFDPFNANLASDDLLDQEMNFQMYHSDTDGYFVKGLLINDISSY